MPVRKKLFVDPVGRHVGSRVQLHRMRKAFTQAELGKAIGVSEQTVRGYEKGTMALSLFRLARICTVLGISPDMLLHGAPTGFEKPVPVYLGSMGNADTRRLLAAWDAITGNARKRVLGIVVTLARSCQDRAELEAFRAAAPASTPVAP